MILTTIQQALPDLSKSERKVGEFVLAHPHAMTTSLAEAAMLVGVSEPTVIRFCRAVGCAGFQDLKLKLAGDLARRIPLVHRDVRVGDDASAYATRLTDAAIAALTQVRNRLDGRALTSAVAAMTSARRLFFVGFGASAGVAADARRKFARLGLAVADSADAHEQAALAALMTAEDVLVAVSHTGESALLTDVVEAAKSVGAKTIAVTRSASPLSAIADLTLAVDVAEDTSLQLPMASRLAHTHLLDIVQVGVALKLGDALEPKLAAAKAALASRRRRADGAPLA